MRDDDAYDRHLHELFGEGTWVEASTADGQTGQVLYYSRRLTDDEKQMIESHFMQLIENGRVVFRPRSPEEVIRPMPEIRIPHLTDPSKTLVEWAEIISNLRRQYPDNAVLTFHAEEEIRAVLTLDKSIANEAVEGDVTLSVSDVVISSKADLR